MIDIKKLRENPEFFKEAVKWKKTNVDIDEILKLDKKNRELIVKIEKLRAQLKKQSKSKPSPEEIEKLKVVGEDIKALEKLQAESQTAFNELIYKIPNPPSDDTPKGTDEKANKILRTMWEMPKFDFKPREHWEIGKDLQLIEIEKAGEVSGTRFAYLKNELALMQFALVQYTFSILTDEDQLKKIIKRAKLDVSSKPFIPVIPPAFIKPEVMHKMARLEPKEERYYIQSDDQYLIGSAEHTLGPLHMDETLKEEDLPVRYVGYSSSFRREAGSYGKDVKGIIRVHQFDKIEMATFTTPEKSVDEQNFIVAIQEYLVQSLEIPYRVMQISTGDMGGPDYRQIDIECWMPGQNTYRETHTSDLNTDYQSRRLKTRFKKKSGEVELVHMNDATAFAIGRTLVAVLENYQQKDGSVAIPKVLQKYMGIKKISKK